MAPLQHDLVPLSPGCKGNDDAMHRSMPSGAPPPDCRVEEAQGRAVLVDLGPIRQLRPWRHDPYVLDCAALENPAEMPLAPGLPNHHAPLVTPHAQVPAPD